MSAATATKTVTLAQVNGFQQKYVCSMIDFAANGTEISHEHLETLKNNVRKAFPTKRKSPPKPEGYPARAKNHWFIFSKMERAKHDETVAVPRLKQIWNGLTLEQQQHYKDLAAEDRQRFEKELEEFYNKFPEHRPKNKKQKTEVKMVVDENDSDDDQPAVKPPTKPAGVAATKKKKKSKKKTKE